LVFYHIETAIVKWRHENAMIPATKKYTIRLLLKLINVKNKGLSGI
jgi:hypothetical protein